MNLEGAGRVILDRGGRREQPNGEQASPLCAGEGVTFYKRPT